MEFINLPNPTRPQTFQIRCVSAIADRLAAAIDGNRLGVAVVYACHYDRSGVAYVFGELMPGVDPARVRLFAAGYLWAWIDASPAYKGPEDL